MGSKSCAASAAVCLYLALTFNLQAAEEPPSAVGSVMKLLKSGRVPEQRLSAIVEIVGTRGNEHDLAYLFEQSLSGTWPVDLKRQSLQLLIDAAKNRKVSPKADFAPLPILIADSAADANLRELAAQLAGAINATTAADALGKIAVNADESQALRSAAIISLVAISREQSRPVITALLDKSQPYAIRALAVEALAELDLASAAEAATQLLGATQPTDDPAPVVDALLDRKGGAEQLAEKISASPPPADVAKLALRHMYSIGRSDEGLATALGKAAGINEDPEPLTPERLVSLVEEVKQHGEAARGEEVFRRADLSCMKCHSVSAAGGQVGPDLSALGPISPIDFLVTSVMNPDQAIKEAYITRVVATVEGEVIQGILVDRSSERLVLKDATGVLHTVPTADIDQEVEGKSLMPKGLVRFMTHQEFLDLVAFLSQLGRPGEYAIRTTPRFQRYRVLPATPPELADVAPNDEQFEAGLFRATTWQPLYARVNGTVPLSDAGHIAKSPVVYLYTEFEVAKPGLVEVVLNSAEGVHAWLDDDSLPLMGDSASPQVSEGRHRLTLRIDTRTRAPRDLRIELRKPDGSEAEFRPVDGA